MPPEGRKPGTPQEWLRRAKSNLTLASQPKLEQVYWEDLCFEAQQAAEKAIKAVLLSKGVRFRFVHDIAELLTLLEQNSVTAPETVRAAAALTDYSVESRYPGPFEPVTESEFIEALRIARSVVSWAEAQIST
jgi:HEPN domain-containing protein